MTVNGAQREHGARLIRGGAVAFIILTWRRERVPNRVPRANERFCEGFDPS
jgi:hypothetical protein